MVCAQKKVVVEVQDEPEEEEAFLPEGTPLLTVAGVELPESAVGPALEFLEFCAAFYKVSDQFNMGDVGDYMLCSFIRGYIFCDCRGIQCAVSDIMFSQLVHSPCLFMKLYCGCSLLE